MLNLYYKKKPMYSKQYNIDKCLPAKHARLNFLKKKDFMIIKLEKKHIFTKN